MKEELFLRKTLTIGIAFSLLASTVGCNTNKEQETSKSETKEEQEVSENETKTSNYLVTEENDNPELMMNQQPEVSYWFPEELLKWTPEEDDDFVFNVSNIPLAPRMDEQYLAPVNKTQNTDTKIMAISIMNASTSGNAPHGLNKVDCNTFTFWQYVDQLIYWGGSSGEGIIVPPSPDVTNAGHKNGVPVLGTVFFPQLGHGGEMEWLDTFLSKDESDQFLLVDKLVLVARIFGFDGWFINQETEGSEEEPLTAEHAVLMQEFIRAYKEAAPELELVYYDSMTVDGEMDWQNALTDKNKAYLKDDEGNSVADTMFLNFWWTNEKLADDELLKSSRELADENDIDPYSLYAGIDVQSNGYTTPIRWDLFEDNGNSTYTSLGLYCPSWAYFSASDFDDFHTKETALWVNSKSDPSAEISYTSNEQWRGISTYVTEKSAITSLPFITNFNTGSGYSFFREGEQISKLDWNNRSISDVLPTYRFLMEHEGENKLKGSFDVGHAWYGGNSLKFMGNMEKDKKSILTLYRSDLPLSSETNWTTTAKASTETAMDLVLTFDDDAVETITGDQKVGTDWSVITYDVSAYAGKNVRNISYQLATEKAQNSFEIYFGNISVYQSEHIKNAEVTNLVADGIEFDEDAMYAGVRLYWESSEEVPYYEIYRINEDDTRSLLGVSKTNCFYVNTLPRTDQTNKSRFEVLPADYLQQQGKGETTEIDWPDNSLPKADFKASQTLIAPGQEIVFESTSSANTQQVAWTLPGASEETASGENVTVTYDQEGVYDVTIKVSNDSGDADKTVTGCIVVTKKLTGDLSILSAGKEADATGYTNEDERPGFAVDGDISKKWCATGTPPHELTIDLGESAVLSQVNIFHAEAGGEGDDMNTKAYTILVSSDGEEYEEVVSVTKNSAGETIDTFAPIEARFVKLSVIKPTQGSDTATRIYEVEVYGMEGGL